MAEMLFYLSDPARRRELEEYRIKFEAEHGPTDLTKLYTSMWPEVQQDWLLQNHPQQWFTGLPEFAKAYVRQKMQFAAEAGKLDDMPSRLIELFISRQMHLGTDARGR